MARRSIGSAPSSKPTQVIEAAASLDDLRAEWQRLYRQEAPKISRDLLTLGIAYRRQELEHGGLGKATIRKLKTVAKSLRETGRVGPSPGLSLKPGARLVREWNGRTHTVTATENGFDYAGKQFSSLTKIARTITGTRWSGPRFFGLKAKSKDKDHARDGRQIDGSA
jgi:hypothetical protein